jgi:hypothetical protein
VRCSSDRKRFMRAQLNAAEPTLEAENGDGMYPTAV